MTASWASPSEVSATLNSSTMWGGGSLRCHNKPAWPWGCPALPGVCGDLGPPGAHWPWAVRSAPARGWPAAGTHPNPERASRLRTRGRVSQAPLGAASQGSLVSGACPASGQPPSRLGPLDARSRWPRPGRWTIPSSTPPRTCSNALSPAPVSGRHGEGAAEALQGPTLGPAPAPRGSNLDGAFRPWWWGHRAPAPAPVWAPGLLAAPEPDNWGARRRAGAAAFPRDPQSHCVAFPWGRPLLSRGRAGAPPEAR